MNWIHFWRRNDLIQDSFKVLITSGFFFAFSADLGFFGKRNFIFKLRKIYQWFSLIMITHAE
jgi:hypothetical protein